MSDNDFLGALIADVWRQGADAGTHGPILPPQREAAFRQALIDALKGRSVGCAASNVVPFPARPARHDIADPEGPTPPRRVARER